MPQEFCCRHWLSCSFTERSGWVTVCASVWRQRAQQGRPQESKTLLPAAQSFKLAPRYQPSVGSKMVLSEKAEGAAGARCRSVLCLHSCAFPQSWGVNLNTEFSQSEGSCCAVSTAVLWLWYSIEKWV